MLTITLPDGNSLNFPKKVTGKEIAEKISKSLAKQAMVISVDGELKDLDYLLTSTKNGMGLDKICDHLVSTVKHTNYDSIVSNSRHFNELKHTLTAILAVQRGLSSGLTGDLLAVDLRLALHHLGMITGSISSDEILGNIFSNFCIGK